jgi:uncharacterized membrane protein
MRRLKATIRLFLSQRYLSNRVLLAKAIIYRFYSVSITFLLTLVVTQNLGISIGVSAFEFFGKTLLYFIFDVSWNNMIKRA